MPVQSPPLVGEMGGSPEGGVPRIHNDYATKIVRGGKIVCRALVQCLHPSYIRIGVLRFSTGETYSPGP